MITLVLATRNAHKVQEIRSILGAGHRYFSLDDFAAAPLVHEDGATFEENATKKATELGRWLLKNPKFAAPLLVAANPEERGPVLVLADDSGLEVDALDGAPGVHSARFAHVGTKWPGNAPDAANNQKLLAALKSVPQAERTARFRCVIAATPLEVHNELRRTAGLLGNVLETRTILSHGTCEGVIALAPDGRGGFGYDPLFVPQGQAASFASLGDDVKNQLSHRGKALQLLKKWLDTLETKT
jgi:XTP/dITP diphosphohydrolase